MSSANFGYLLHSAQHVFDLSIYWTMNIMNFMGCVGLGSGILRRSPKMLAKMLLYLGSARLTGIPYIRDYITQSSFKISVREYSLVSTYVRTKSVFIFCLFDSPVGVFSLFLVCHVVPVSVL